MKINMDINILKLIILWGTFLLITSQDPTVTTRFGRIIGSQKSVRVDGVDRNISVYLGIPYARPPVNELRFQKPKPITEMDTPFQARVYGKFCPQASRTVLDGTEITRSTLVQDGTEYSENCLFLNVFVPDVLDDSSDKLAVMIWIHGGGFISDASNEYDGSVLAAYGNVIVVTINYRLGVFGFLSTGDSNAPGNYGLWDQHLAFQWVHDNIAAFRGDAQRVTIVGESAGAMSVIQQGFFPRNKGLFQRVIAQSGTPTKSPMDISRDVLKDAHNVGQILGCTAIKSTKRLVECLRNKTVNEIYGAVNEGKVNIGRFIPSIDGDFIKINPNDIPEELKSRDLTEVEFFKSLDFLSGFNAYEGAVILFVILKGEVENFTPSRADLVSTLIPVAMQLTYKHNLDKELVQLVASQYTDWETSDDPSSTRLQFLKLLGDALYNTAAVELARIHTKSSAPNHTYIYYLTPKPEKQLWFAPSWIPEATHGDDLPLLFPTEDSLPDSDPDRPWKIKLSRKLITYWTNFVKTGIDEEWRCYSAHKQIADNVRRTYDGHSIVLKAHHDHFVVSNPNLPVKVTPNWPEYTLEDQYYIEFEKNMTNSSVQQYLYSEETNFWREMFPGLIQAIQNKSDGKDCESMTASKGHYVRVHSIVLLISLLISSIVG